MLLLFQVLAVLAVVFGVAAVLTGRAEGLSSESQDLAATGIPRDRAMTPDDVLGLRFALAVRGYRMDEVDDALDRLAAEIAARDEAIGQLRMALDNATSSAALVEEPPEPEEPAAEYVPSDATGELPPDTPVDVPTTPEAWSALDPDVPVADEDTPQFLEPPAPPVLDEPPVPPVPPVPPAPPVVEEPPANPFRPEVPEIPTYDPWSVTPRSRFTEGPTYVEVEHHDDEDVDAITEHQTGHALPPPDAVVADGEPEDADDEPDDEPAQEYRPPWQS